MKKHAIIEWIPGMVTLLLAALLTVYVYTGDTATESGNNWVQFFGAGLSPFFFPIYGLITKKKLPLSLPIIWGIYVIFASYMGSGLRLYHYTDWFDLFAHGLFGLVGSLIVFTFLTRRHGERMGVLACMILILLCVLGLSAIWEIIEYTTDTLTGSDSQMTTQGTFPIQDTMEDIIISMAGVATFYIIFFLDLGFSKLAYRKRAEKQGKEDINTSHINGVFFNFLIGFKGFNPSFEKEEESTDY